MLHAVNPFLFFRRPSCFSHDCLADVIAGAVLTAGSNRTEASLTESDLGQSNSIISSLRRHSFLSTRIHRHSTYSNVIMFSGIVQQHRASVASKRKQVDAQKVEALKAAETVTQHLLNDVSHGVGMLYRAQRDLQSECALVERHSARFGRVASRFLTLSNSLSLSVRELGDVTNWALTIEKDMRWVEQTLHEAIQQSNEQRKEVKERRERWMEAEEEKRRMRAQQDANATGTASPSSAMHHTSHLHHDMDDPTPSTHEDLP